MSWKFKLGVAMVLTPLTLTAIVAVHRAVQDVGWLPLLAVLGALVYAFIAFWCIVISD